jgi:hypothetical protein
MNNQYAGPVIALLAASQLMGCGIAVPNIAEVWDADKPAEAEPRNRAAAVHGGRRQRLLTMLRRGTVGELQQGR